MKRDEQHNASPATFDEFDDHFYDPHREDFYHPEVDDCDECGGEGFVVCRSCRGTGRSR